MGSLEKVIKTICKKRNVSKAKIGRAVGMERGNFGNSVSSNKMKFDTFEKILKSFGVRMKLEFKEEKEEKDESKNK